MVGRSGATASGQAPEGPASDSRRPAIESTPAVFSGSLGMDAQHQAGRRDLGDRSPFLKDALPQPKQGPPAENLPRAPVRPQGAQNQRAEVFHFEAWAIRDRLRAALEAALEETPLEDGFSNPVEPILARTVNLHPQSGARWIREWVLSEKEPEFGRDILICLSRALSRPVHGWALDLAREALASPNVRLRYAAVRALELWKGTAAARLLGQHSEAVPWLAQYIGSVQADLRKTD